MQRLPTYRQWRGVEERCEKAKTVPAPCPRPRYRGVVPQKAIEDAGMKYVHAIEACLTTTLTEKVRDNYHCVLIAGNYDGFLEPNMLVSRSFDRADDHFYYVQKSVGLF